jgi:hypothetical protein
MESSSTLQEDQEPNTWGSEQSDSATDGYETDNKENIPPEVNGANVSPHVDTNGRKTKKNRPF